MNSKPVIKIGDTFEILYTTPKHSKERGRERPIRYRITDNPDERDPANGVILDTAPVAKAAVNHGKGDTVNVKLPGGHRRAKITQHEPEQTR